jgi:NADP-reducing hydrogenase subunit HndB
MPQITSLDGLWRLKVALMAKRGEDASRGAVRISVGLGTCGIAAGALEVLRALEREVSAQHLEQVTVFPTGCMGLCGHEPIVEVTVGVSAKVAYGSVDAAMVSRIVNEHILKGRVVREFVIDTTPFPTI